MKHVYRTLMTRSVGTINRVQQKEIGRLSDRHRGQAMLLQNQKQTGAHPPLTTQQAER